MIKFNGNDLIGNIRATFSGDLKQFAVSSVFIQLPTKPNKIQIKNENEEKEETKENCIK